jgi:Domain of unknown function (DUF4136)
MRLPHHTARFAAALTLLVSLPFTLISCTPIKYHEIQPAAAELKTLKTYRWAVPALTSKAGTRAVEFDSTFRAATEADLAKKGYMLNIDKAEILVDYRISVVTRPGMEDTYYSPHWTSDNRGTFTFTGWQDPQGTGDMLEHGVVTLSMRATKTDSLLWEGGVSKLLRSDESEVNMAEAAKMAANALAKKIPAH